MKSLLKTLALLLLLFSLTFQSFADTNQGTKTLNQGFQEFWSKFFAEVQNRPDVYLEPQIKNILINQKSETKFTILAIEDIKFDLLSAPGFTKLQNNIVNVRAPLEGEWNLFLKAKIKFNKSALFKGSPAFTKVIKLKLKKVYFESELNFSEQSPGLITLAKPLSIDLKFHLSLGTDDVFSSLLVKVLNPFINLKLKSMLADVIKDGVDKFYPIFTAKIHGKGQTSLVKEAGVSNKELEEIALNVEKKISEHHLPYGTLLRAEMDTENYGSWREDYASGARGIDGQVVGWSGEGDSAIWTGHYLAAEAFRYTVTNEAQALKNIKHALSGIDKLLAINGNTGLLARAIFPLNSSLGERILKSGEVFRKKMIDGEMWGSLQGDRGVSIDQNLGILFGLTVAFDHLKNHPDLQAKSAALMKLLVDYYIDHGWMISEDRPEIGDLKNPSAPSHWGGANSKVLTILLQISKMYPGDQKYIEQLKKYQGLENASWLSEWASCLDQFTGYYKYNLAYIQYYMYFNAETDPIRKEVVRRAYDIIQRNTEHHLNPHFNLIRMSIDSSLKKQIAPEVEYAIKEFVKRTHRTGGPKEIDLSGISWDGPFPGDKGKVLKMKLPTYPLDIIHRTYSGFFLWQRSAFEHAIPSSAKSKGEKPGIDLTLPYWMARYEGLLKEI